MTMISRMIPAILLALLLHLGGCAAANLAGVMAQAHDEQKLIDTPPEYAGLENKTVAVLMTADLATLYEHPDAAARLAGGVSARIGQNVPGAKIVNPALINAWQYRTPQWESMPYGELIEQINVDRIVMIDVLEYRLNPPGNRYEWEGVCSATVGVIERDGLDPDQFADSFEISVKYPTVSGVTRDDAPADRIQFGLQYAFVEKASWLFYQHLEPKHPDKYRPELHAQNKKKKS